MAPVAVTMTRHCSVPLRPTTDRRRFLAGALAAGTVVLAGCSGVVNFLGDIALSDLNVFNGTQRRLSGHARVTGPDGETVHDQAFELAPSDGQNGGETTQTDEQEANFEPYDDVFSGAGEYTVTIELADGEQIEGVAETEQTVEVTNPDEEHIVVFLGADDRPAPITIDVIEQLTDLGDGTNSSGS